ncbi:MAG: 4Fe-4S ferredoxin [Candidatus Thermoplasmatota archaeon]|nr:4Fe-4S ferredoxin [Candidatus Thermoplasmatota archaeon]
METIVVKMLGKNYEVPKGLTITKAFEWAGYHLIRGSGCRAGFCGACTTIYRKKGDYKLYTGLACQTLVEENMELVQLPFVPAEKKPHKIDNLKPSGNVILKIYPEIARCLCCNTCTKACPQELEVMDFIQASLKGDLAKVAQLSFDCIQCGICSVRCPADIKHYHVAQLARRLYGKYLTKKSKAQEQRLKEIEKGKFEKDFAEIIALPLEKVRELYKKREIEGE